jgi:hypothetical protein
MAHIDTANTHQGEVAPSTPSGVPAGLKSTFSKIFGSTWGSDNSGNADSGGGLIAAFRAMMPKSGSLSGSGVLNVNVGKFGGARQQHSTQSLFISRQLL